MSRAPDKLEPQEFEISLTLGMATKPAQELQQATHLRLVENLHWRELGALEHRPSDDTNHTVAEPSGSAYDEVDACGLIVRAGVPAVVTGKHGVMTYHEAQALAQWSRSAVASSSTPDATLRYCPTSYDVSRRFVASAQFSKGSTGIWAVTSAQYNGIQVIAWSESLNGASTSRLWLKAVVAETGAVLATSEHISIGAVAALRIHACEYTESGKEGVLIVYDAMSGGSPTNTVSTVRYDYASNQFVADSNLTTDYSGAFALVKNGDRVYFGYHKDSTGRLVVEDRTVGSISSTHTSTTHGADAGIAIVKGTSNTLICSVTSTAAGEAYAEVFGTPGSAINPISAGGLTDDTFLGVAAALEERAGTTHDAVMWVQCYWNGSGVDAMRVRAIEVNFDATTPVEGLSSHLPHCQLASNGFTLRGMAHVVFSVFTYVNGAAADIPVSCFVARYRRSSSVARHDAVARICHDRHFIPSGFTYRVANAAYVDSSNNVWVTLTADPSADSVSGVSLLPQTIFLERISAARPMPMPYTNPEPGVALVAGGIPWVYDGDVASEAAPLVIPKLVLDVAGGSGTTGAFSLIAVYRWTDAAGNVYRMPSLPVSTGSISNKDIDAYVSICPMRTYDGLGLADMEPELYITEDAGSTYYLASISGAKQVYASLSGSASGEELWYRFTDVQPGVSSDPPYPFGDEIEPEPPPAFRHVATVGDRCWGVDAEDTARIWFSKPKVTGFGVEWSGTLTVTVGDDCVAVVDLGGYPTVLARGGLYQIAGPGPDATGLNGTFSPAQKLPFEVDCLDPASVCRTPMGIVFRGRRGLYALADNPRSEPGLLIDPEMLTAADIDPSVSTSYRLRVAYQEQTNEIHCITPSGDRLVYNIVEQKWSKYTTTNTTCRDLAVARGKLWRLERATVAGTDHLRSEKLYSEDGATYNDNDHDWEVRTPWIKLDGLAGQQRLWRLFVVLALPTDVGDISLITVRYYVNNSETVSRSQTWTGAELAAVYADPSTGESIARIPFAPNVQLVHSFRVYVLCTIGQANPTSGPRPLALAGEVGVRKSKGKRNPLPVKG